MARLLTILFIVFSVHAFAQNYPITGILISFPPHPSNTLADWPNSKFTINASTLTTNGKIDGAIVESRILVIIKSKGVKVCGAYTPTSAPAAKFNTGNKIWTGTNAMALLGQDCSLPPGDYELSVQFWGSSSGRPIAFSEEKVQAFSIQANNQTATPNPKLPDTNVEPDANAGSKGGFSININGLGGILFGGAKKTAPACGKITAVTRIICAGRNQQSGLTSYNITIIFTNNPIDQVKSCTFVLNAITTQSKGSLKFPDQALPVAVASTAKVSYTFIYTPASAKATDAQFTMSGTWEGNAIPLELKPAFKLPVCLDCSCGTWDNLTVANPPGLASAAAAVNSSKYESGKAIAWHCGLPFNFSSTYQRSGGAAECKVATTCDIQKDGTSIKTVNGTNNINDTFTPAGNGIYTITLNANCGGITCPPAVYTVLVKDCQTEAPPNPPADPPLNPVTIVPKIPVTVPPINVQVHIPASNPKKQDKQLNNTGHFYYIIPPEYTGEVVNAADTLFLQVENNYSSGSNQLTYTIRNLSNEKTSGSTNLKVTNNQGLIRIALPLQNTVVAKGETGLFIMGDYKKYYYISFKRN